MDAPVGLRLFWVAMPLVGNLHPHKATHSRAEMVVLAVAVVATFITVVATAEAMVVTAKTQGRDPAAQGKE